MKYGFEISFSASDSCRKEEFEIFAVGIGHVRRKVQMRIGNVEKP